MSKKALITIFGSIVIVLPFVGLPNSLSTPIFVFVGIATIAVARMNLSRRK